MAYSPPAGADAHQALQPFLDHMGVDLAWSGWSVLPAAFATMRKKIGPPLCKRWLAKAWRQHVRAAQCGARGGRRPVPSVACEMLPRRCPSRRTDGNKPFRGRAILRPGHCFFFSCFSASIAAR